MRLALHPPSVFNTSALVPWVCVSGGVFGSLFSISTRPPPAFGDHPSNSTLCPYVAEMMVFRFHLCSVCCHLNQHIFEEGKEGALSGHMVTCTRRTPNKRQLTANRRAVNRPDRFPQTQKKEKARPVCKRLLWNSRLGHGGGVQLRS